MQVGLTLAALPVKMVGLVLSILAASVPNPKFLLGSQLADENSLARGEKLIGGEKALIRNAPTRISY